MRSIFNFSLVLFFSLSAAAVDFNVRVLDPQSAAVAGVQVSVLNPGQKTVSATAITSASGVAVFHVQSAGAYQVRVLAPGFAAETVDVPPDVKPTDEITIHLHLAAASETVVVSATRTPVPGQETAASVSLLSGPELEAMQPTSLADALRFEPGTAVAVAGQRGGLGSLFVEGGDSGYNKVLLDGVPINDPGGIFNVATLPVAGTDRVEFLRGAQSTLYGSDAMTSVIELFSHNGTTAVPELRLGADGGNFGTAHGFMSLSGARGRFDYDAFADQFNTNGQGPNNDYTNALQGGNAGVQIAPWLLLRVRGRHSNSRTGAPGEWDFNNQPLFSPDLYAFARANDSVGSAELDISAPSHWQHRLTGYDYNTRRLNQDNSSASGCFTPPYDCPYISTAHLNRAGLMYQGDYTPRTWLQTTVGYEFEDENARLYTNAPTSPPPTYTGAVRLNHSAYVQQRVSWKRLTAVAGVRYVHEAPSGQTIPVQVPLPPPAPGINKAVPRVALSLLALKGGGIFTGTRLRFSYAEGIKEPRFEEEYAGPPYSISNTSLRPERNRSFEAGFDQGMFGPKLTLSGLYFNNLFHDLISYVTVNPATFVGQYQNVDRSMAQGAETRLVGHLSPHLSVTTAYTYTSSQYLTGTDAGQSLLRRPKHSGTLRATYLRKHWGADLGGSFVGRRNDSDFLGLGIDHASGYALVNLGGWYTVNSRVTAYVNVGNALNAHYNEVVGYPALTANFRAGFRFRIGGEK
jgi:outer membrane cobalamin receptor